MYIFRKSVLRGTKIGLASASTLLEYIFGISMHGVEFNPKKGQQEVPSLTFNQDSPCSSETYLG